MIKECLWCGKKFNTSHNIQKYCSRNCSAKSQSKKVIKTCPICKKEFLARIYKLRPNRGKYCSRKCYSKASSVMMKGHPSYTKHLVEDKHWNWKGDDVGYDGLHDWVRKNLGYPHKCSHCGKIGKRNNGRWNIHWANRTGEYLRDKDDWIALCVSCHRKYDMTLQVLKRLRQQAFPKGNIPWNKL
jgi:hypothetical protein